MVIASLTGFLRIILIFLVFYFLLKLIGRLVIPWLAKKAKNKMSERMQEEMRNREETHRPPRQEGEVTIEYSKDNIQDKKSKNPQKGSGDYVDFEELDK